MAKGPSRLMPGNGNPHLKLYRCVAERCPTPLRRAYVQPKCLTHGLFMKEIDEKDILKKE